MSGWREGGRQLADRPNASSGGVRPGTTKFVRNDKPKKGESFTADPEQVAADFGFKMVFINSDPALKAAFDGFMQEYVAAKGKISQGRFDLMMDKWAADSGFTATYLADRKLELEQPEDYAQLLDSDVATLRDQARQMGAQIDDATLLQFAKNARRLGLNAAQQRDGLAQYVSAAGMDYEGQAGKNQDDLVAWAVANGVSMSPGMIDSYVRKLATGETNLDEIKSDIRKTYMSGAFPAWSDRINAGWDIADIAAPYKQAMGKLLEVDPQTISFSDPLLAAGLQATDKDGKPAVMPLYEYENMVRKDPRWQQTDNAYQTYAGVAQNLLRTFGFA